MKDYKLKQSTMSGLDICKWNTIGGYNWFCGLWFFFKTWSGTPSGFLVFEDSGGTKTDCRKAFVSAGTVSRHLIILLLVPRRLFNQVSRLDTHFFLLLLVLRTSTSYSADSDSPLFTESEGAWSTEFLGPWLSSWFFQSPGDNNTIELGNTIDKKKLLSTVNKILIDKISRSFFIIDQLLIRPPSYQPTFDSEESVIDSW